MEMYTHDPAFFSLAMTDAFQASRIYGPKRKSNYMECKFHAIYLIYLDRQVYIDG